MSRDPFLVCVRTRRGRKSGLRAHCWTLAAVLPISACQHERPVECQQRNRALEGARPPGYGLSGVVRTEREACRRLDARSPPPNARARLSDAVSKQLRARRGLLGQRVDGNPGLLAEASQWAVGRALHAEIGSTTITARPRCVRHLPAALLHSGSIPVLRTQSHHDVISIAALTTIQR